MERQHPCCDQENKSHKVSRVSRNGAASLAPGQLTPVGKPGLFLTLGPAGNSLRPGLRAGLGPGGGERCCGNVRRGQGEGHCHTAHRLTQGQEAVQQGCRGAGCRRMGEAGQRCPSECYPRLTPGCTLGCSSSCPSAHPVTPCEGQGTRTPRVAAGSSDFIAALRGADAWLSGKGAVGPDSE